MADDPAAKRLKKAEYNSKRTIAGRAKRYTLEYGCNEETNHKIKQYLSRAKTILSGHSQKEISNAEAISQVFQYFMNANEQSDHDSSAAKCTTTKVVPGFVSTNPDDVDQSIFLTGIKSIDNLCDMVSFHARTCDNPDLRSAVNYQRGHASVLGIQCSTCNGSLPPWPSSPYLPNHKFLVNFRVAHGYFSAGILYSQYKRFAQIADIGCITDTYLRENMMSDRCNYNVVVEEEYTKCCNEALLEEIGQTVLHEDDMYHGIHIMTDARHGWRRNSRQTDVVCIGQYTHKVLLDAIVSKDDDISAQRHEKLGTVQIYEHLQTHEDGPIPVATHAHDRNLSINKFLREEHPDTTNQNDTWHVPQ